MEISINNNMESLPSISKLGYQSKQFYSFKHKSIQENNDDKKSSVGSGNIGDLDFNTLFENSISSNENINMDIKYESENESDSEESYKSLEEHVETGIKIETNNVSNTVYVCRRQDQRYNMNESITRKDIELIDSNEDYTSISYPLANGNGGSLSNSFKEYLSTSYNFLKMSFNYLKTI